MKTRPFSSYRYGFVIASPASASSFTARVGVDAGQHIVVKSCQSIERRVVRKAIGVWLPANRHLNIVITASLARPAQAYIIFEACGGSFGAGRLPALTHRRGCPTSSISRKLTSATSNRASSRCGINAGRAVARRAVHACARKAEAERARCPSCR